MADVKLIAFDLDDTLFNKKKEITPETLETLERAASMGIEIVPATGRFWRAVPENLRALDFVRYAITLNGAAIFDIKAMKTLAEFMITVEQAVTMCRVFDDLPVIYDFVADGEGFMKREHYDSLADFMYGQWQTEIVRKMRTPVNDVYETLRTKKGVQKMQIYTLDNDLRENLLKSFPNVFPKLLFTSSVPNNIEINDTKAHKGHGLKFIAEYLGIPISSTLAFGDGLNDMSMIETAGIGVAMGNACPELLRAAKYVTNDCENNGVSEGIKKFCF